MMKSSYMNNPELQPCPHCGRKVNYLTDVDGIPCGIYCMKCRAVTKYTDMAYDKIGKVEIIKAELAERWNKRMNN